MASDEPIKRYYLNVRDRDTDDDGKSLEEYKLHSDLMIVIRHGKGWLGPTTFGQFRFDHLFPEDLELVQETLADLIQVDFHSGRYRVGGRDDKEKEP